jgi:hypothetical protein
VANVECEEMLEERGMARADLEGEGAEARGAIHKQQRAGHEVREAVHCGVVALVLAEVVGLEGGGESQGLAEAEGEAFAGDGVYGAGGVANEGDVAAGDAAEFAAEGDGAAWGVAG